MKAVASKALATRGLVTRGLALAALGGALVLSAPARAQGALTLYCGVQEEWCRGMVQAFERETGVKVAMTRKSAGETFAQLKAESANPRGDVWWGGTGDPHAQAAEEGLTQEYASPRMGELQDWAVRAWEQTGHRAVGIYSGALGFGYNARTIASRGVAEPQCWADLADAKLADEVQVADPNSSGTAYTLLATILQIMGEEKGFAYLKALHRNVNQYTKSGAAPAKAVSLGETAVGITFMHDMITLGVDNPDVRTVAPCEGTGYEIGSMSIIKGAKNLDNARRFYDWALTPAAQAIGAEAKSFQVPSNRAAPIPPQAPKLSQIKLIAYDFVKYGSNDERRRILAKWDREVKGGAK